MKSFYKLDEIMGQQLAGGGAYREFLRVPAMSCGIYMLAPGAADPQTPHAEDELYYVIAGAARMMVYGEEGAEDRAVGPGDIVFVKAGQRHYFYEVSRGLAVLVTFAPAETHAKH